MFDVVNILNAAQRETLLGLEPMARAEWIRAAMPALKEAGRCAYCHSVVIQSHRCLSCGAPR